jgi:PTH1 family peptidyl-tRNA hydrolase
MLRRPLFIASIGNPSPAYTNTLHSAGHTLLNSLRETLAYPPFSKNRTLANGLFSSGDQYVLWQSPSLMNVSGKNVASAWKSWLRTLPSNEDRNAARLVIVHDELESPLGKIKLRQGGSPKGHNGIKSCVSSLGGMGFARIGVGIGRCESREPHDVSAYVLRKMTMSELQKVWDGVGPLMMILNELRDG